MNNNKHTNNINHPHQETAAAPNAPVKTVEPVKDAAPVASTTSATPSDQAASSKQAAPSGQAAPNGKAAPNGQAVPNGQTAPLVKKSSVMSARRDGDTTVGAIVDYDKVERAPISDTGKLIMLILFFLALAGAAIFGALSWWHSKLDDLFANLDGAMNSSTIYDVDEEDDCEKNGTCSSGENRVDFGKYYDKDRRFADIGYATAHSRGYVLSSDERIVFSGVVVSSLEPGVFVINVGGDKQEVVELSGIDMLCLKGVHGGGPQRNYESFVNTEMIGTEVFFVVDDSIDNGDDTELEGYLAFIREGDEDWETRDFGALLIANGFAFADKDVSAFSSGAVRAQRYEEVEDLRREFCYSGDYYCSSKALEC